MKNEIKTLCKKFEEIKELGWIESVNKGRGSVGLTFESLLGVQNNELEIPDYNGIEIKTKSIRGSFVNKYITLFNCKPEGRYYHEVERLKDTYGYPHKNLVDYKVLNECVYGNRLNKIGSQFYFKLFVDYKAQKIYLYVYNLNKKLIEKDVFWDFEELKQKLYRKLQNLALVKAKTKRSLLTRNEQFNYCNLTIYKLKDFDAFLNMIERGEIRVTFKLSVWTSGDKFGKIHDHGTGFDIKEESITGLYEKIY